MVIIKKKNNTYDLVSDLLKGLEKFPEVLKKKKIHLFNQHPC